jgi:hypothetical protein
MNRLPLLLSPMLFAIACCLPALEFHKSEGGTDLMWGANILVVGWSGIFADVMAWYANPFWIAALVLGWFRKPLLAAPLSLIAIWIAYSTFSLLGRVLPADEGNVNHMTLIRVLPGFYFWMASLAVLPIVVFFPGRR